MSEAAVERGTIHDLAYRAYKGRRTHPLGRFSVVARYALRFQLRQRSVKVLIALGLFAIVGCGVVLASTTLLVGRMGEGRGERIFANLTMKSESIVSFLLVLVCGAPALAADLNAGAFQFHFARPVALGQYLAGRVISAGGLALGVSLLSLSALTLERMALGGATMAVLVVSLKLGLALCLRVLTYASVALGLSSLTRRRAMAQAMFAGMVVFTWMFTRLLASDVDSLWWVSGASVGGAADMVCDQLLGEVHLRGVVGLVPGLSCLGWVALSLAVAWWRLSRAEVVRG